MILMYDTEVHIECCRWMTGHVEEFRVVAQRQTDVNRSQIIKFEELGRRSPICQRLIGQKVLFLNI